MSTTNSRTRQTSGGHSQCVQQEISASLELCEEKVDVACGVELCNEGLDVLQEDLQHSRRHGFKQ